jgi:hypothetical protein
MDCFNKYFRSHTKEFREVNAFNNIDLSSSQYTESRNRANKILQDLCAQFQTTLLQYEAEIKLQKTQHSSSSSSTTVSATKQKERAKKDTISAIAGRLESKGIKDKFNTFKQGNIQVLMKPISVSSNIQASTNNSEVSNMEI